MTNRFPTATQPPRNEPARLAGLLAFSLILLLPAGGARAAEEEEERVSYTVTKWAYKHLSEAHALISKGKLNEATKLMDRMKGRSSLNDHERALMWQTYGYIYSARENFPKAIKAFETCLAMKAMPKGTLLDMEFNLGQLYMANKQYAKAVQVLTAWMGKAEKPSANAKHLLSMALTMTKDWKRALHWIRQAIADVGSPQETWLQLELSILFEMNRPAEMAGVLQRLISRFPKQTYWLQLSAVYSQLKQEDQALAVAELAYLQGYIKQHSELMNLVSLYLFRGIPVKAARVLEKGIAEGRIKRTEQTLTMLGDAWMRSRDYQRAVKPLSDAAQLSGKGDLWVRVAQLHMEQERWEQAAGALHKAIKKGKLSTPGNAHLLLGISLFRANKFKQARAAFDSARKHKSSQQSAEAWLKSLAAKTKPSPR